MTPERFQEIFDNTKSEWEGDNALQGCIIISKYIDPKKEAILAAAEHDIIYSVDVEDILNAGITEEDAVALAKLNWMIDTEYGECLAVFV